MSDSADRLSCEASHGFGGADDEGDDEPLDPADDLAGVGAVVEWLVCGVDGCGLALCDGRGEVLVPVGAAAPDELSEVSTRKVSALSTTSARTEAPKAKRRRQ